MLLEIDEQILSNIIMVFSELQDSFSKLSHECSLNKKALIEIANKAKQEAAKKQAVQAAEAEQKKVEAK